MKKYIIFAISFIFIFSLFQFLSGMLLTFIYTPNVEDAWNMSANLPQEVVLESNPSPILTLLIALISATVAYYISEKSLNNNSHAK